jgi:hypothetical protein
MYILAILSLLVSIAVAERNITVDDFNRDRITYFPASAWVSLMDITATSDRYKMTTTFTAKQGAYAAFNFTGATAFYFMGYGGVPTQGPLGTIGIVFNDQLYTTSENIDLTSQAQQILFSRKNLDVNKDYTVKVMKTSADGGGHDLNIDAMIYTVPDAPSQGSGSGGVAGGGNANGSGNGSGSGIFVGAIIGGIAGGVCVTVLVMFLLRWLRHRRNQDHDDPLATAPYILPLHTSSTTVSFGSKQHQSLRYHAQGSLHCQHTPTHRRSP